MNPELVSSDEELRNRFFDLRNLQDLADLLEVKDRLLIYLLYVMPIQKKYVSFFVPKRSGGSRLISSPAISLKVTQRRLNQVLNTVYSAKEQVTGFVQNRSIVSNAEIHVRQNYVLNIDLKDFFPSINFGRVRGMFMANPYRLQPAVATILTNLICFENQLPQGAPTSPTVSNMICAKMDSQLSWLAEKHKCLYTRYADDITFSTSRSHFPNALARRIAGGKRYKVGAVLQKSVRDNGFEINPDKVRIQHTTERQEVTGLVTNTKVNVPRSFVRQIRAMLHAWEKYGHFAAEREHIRRYDRNYHGPHKRVPSFRDIVKGKIQYLRMVKGKDDPVYKRYWDQFGDLEFKEGRKKVRAAVQERALTRDKQYELSFRYWLDSLPFPLAIILWNYHASGFDDEKQYRHLLHFFEALTEYMATILLSAAWNDRILFEELITKISKQYKGFHSPWTSPTLGTWKSTFAISAKVLRTMHSSGVENRERCRKLFQTNNDHVIEILTSKNWATIFGQVNEWRNKWTGHGGIASPKDAQYRHALIKEKLDTVKSLFENVWELYELVRPTSMKKQSGQYIHTVERIMGRSTPFEKSRFIIDRGLETNELHLVSHDDHGALELLPLVKLGPAPEGLSNACYFYNRVEDAKSRKLRYVSYHFENESEFRFIDSRVTDALHLLS